MNLSAFKKLSLLLLAALIATPTLFAQTSTAGKKRNTITTAVPFLIIAPDSRAGGMGEAGVSSLPDANSMHWNPAKLTFAPGEMGFSMSYSPWLKALSPDINLAYLTGYRRLGDNQALGLELLYFSLGDIQFLQDIDAQPTVARPNEFSVAATYSRKLAEHVSGAVSGRFIHSNLTQGYDVGSQTTKPGNSVAADVAFYGQHPIYLSGNDGFVNWGVNVSNIGSKINYTNDNNYKNSIPTNLRFGPSLVMNINDYNQFTFSVDINKLLVPTEPERDENGDIISGKDPNVSVPVGMLQSFYDAPGGFSEELKEFSIATGLEYWYDQIFAIRGGYFHEDMTKGDRRFFTAGAGLKYNVFALDFAYLIPVSQNHPLANTLRFSLHFNFDPYNQGRR